MAEAQQPSIPHSQPQAIPGRDTAVQIPTALTATLPPSSSASRIRSSHLALDTFSPHGNPYSLVLRPNYLSIYKDQNEDKLRHKIHLSDLTAVAFLKDPKQKRRNVFGLFTPSRNYHLEATTKGDAEEWVDLIRKEGRIDEERREEMLLASPSGNITSTYPGFDQAMANERLQRRTEAQILHDERLGSSSPEPTEPILYPREQQTKI
ncbi:hypothetical protein DID88_007177 [Monilinia fructigena]|uniref:PH domain-containing protein n=1 Tax=Monilinia fructigena TaxID=38457 RepID=A0A395J8J4_9HELO|nr:hypothetical protein DID88_007177 [Monilinia fructigena]